MALYGNEIQYQYLENPLGKRITFPRSDKPDYQFLIVQPWSDEPDLWAEDEANGARTRLTAQDYVREVIG